MKQLQQLKNAFISQCNAETIDPTKIHKTSEALRALAVELETCPECFEATFRKPFKDSISRKEAKLSGLCMECQPLYFDKGDWS